MEVLAILGILGGLITAYTALNVRIASIEVRTKQLESNLTISVDDQETLRKENREDHKALMDKMDKLINKV
jgi:hypothetical protein